MSRRLKDVDAITQLTYRYARAVDKGPGRDVDLSAIPRLFTADARWSGDGLGTIGAAAIVAELPTATAAIEHSSHAFLNPIITVDGDHASANWLLWITSVQAGRPAAIYLIADLTYRRTGNGWLIDAVRIGGGIRIPTA